MVITQAAVVVALEILLHLGQAAVDVAVLSMLHVQPLLELLILAVAVAVLALMEQDQQAVVQEL